MAAIYQRVKTSKGWRYRALPTGRGRRAADSATPPFYLRFTLNGKQQWSDPYQSLPEAKKAVEELPDVIEARAKGLSLHELAETRNANRVPIKTAIEEYLAQKAGKSKKTIQQYRLTLNEFLESVRVRFLDEIDVAVLRQYKNFLMTEGYSGKTQDTRLNIVYFLLKKNGIAARLPRDEMPVIEEEVAIPYIDSELKKLFAAMDDEQKIRYKFFLGTGCRDKEVTFAAWNDIDFEKRTYHVRRKEDVGFTPKSHESRTVPLPASLVDLLRARRKKAPHERWIFVNEEGRPDNHFLRKLKRIALHAGLNCGQCRTTLRKGKYEGVRPVEVTCKTDPVCEHFYLHRSRRMELRSARIAEAAEKSVHISITLRDMSRELRRLPMLLCAQEAQRRAFRRNVGQHRIVPEVGHESSGSRARNAANRSRR